MSNFVARDESSSSLSAIWMPWLVCLSAGLFFFYEFFQLNLFDVINQSLRDDFHLDADGLSWMSSTYLWANVLFLIPAGIILDKLSPRRLILIALSLCVVGTIGFGLTHSFVCAAWCHALTGIGNAFCFLSCVVLVSRWFHANRQAFVIGCIVTMAFIGGMAAHTPLVYLVQRFGWREALLIDGAVGLGILIWIVFTVRDKPAHALNPVELVIQQPAGFYMALCNRQNWLAGLYTACLNLPIMVLCALWGVTYLMVMHHVSALAASNVVSLIYVGSIVGCPLVGWLSDYLNSRKRVMLWGALLSGAALMVLVLSYDLPEVALCGLFFLIGLFTSTQVISYPLVASSNHPSNAGAANGVTSVIVMSGGGIAQILFGLLLQHHAGKVMKVYQYADFQFAVWMFPIAVILALGALLFLVEPNDLSRRVYANH